MKCTGTHRVPPDFVKEAADGERQMRWLYSDQEMHGSRCMAIVFPINGPGATYMHTRMGVAFSTCFTPFPLVRAAESDNQCALDELLRNDDVMSANFPALASLEACPLLCASRRSVRSIPFFIVLDIVRRIGAHTFVSSRRISELTRSLGWWRGLRKWELDPAFLIKGTFEVVWLESCNSSQPLHHFFLIIPCFATFTCGFHR